MLEIRSHNNDHDGILMMTLMPPRQCELSLARARMPA
jgi:hypothetical protein